jgi:K+-sensing histidine kinase KdpD
MRHPSPALRYGVPVLAVAAAMVVRWPLWGVLHGELAFLFLLPVVILCAWYGGLWPDLLATALSALSAAFFLLEPRYSLAVANPADLLGLWARSRVSGSTGRR